MAETSENKSGSTPQGELIEENSKPFQLIKYFFDVVNDDTVTYNAQITDNWIESNSAIQDHIALQPVTITMRGLCGELVYDAKQAELDYKTEDCYVGDRNRKVLESHEFQIGLERVRLEATKNDSLAVVGYGEHAV